jgi:hypothetical protein
MESLRGHSPAGQSPLAEGVTSERRLVELEWALVVALGLAEAEEWLVEYVQK